MNTRVLGYVVAQNEWPLLGLSISHALHMGVEHVIAVNHRSTDETAQGLQKLKNAWPDRLTVHSIDVTGFPQDIISKVVLRGTSSSGYDWVYAFDADEFLLTEENQPLPNMLTRIPANVDVVRYELDQWVAPHDMDDLVPEQFKRFTQRAVVCDQTKQDGVILGDDLVAGNINYFDIPFPSKVIVRNKYAHQLLPGAHGLKPDATSDKKVTEAIVTKSRMRVAHLPLTSKRRLIRKALLGRAHVVAGLPRGHGWQNQALHRIVQAGRLESYWQDHSITGANDMDNPFGKTPSSSLPPLVEDMALNSLLQRATDALQAPEQYFSTAEQNCYSKRPCIDLAPIISLLTDQQISTKNKIEELQSHISDLHSQLTARGNQIRQQQEHTKHVVMMLQSQVDTLLRSSSWKLTAPLRFLVERFRKLRWKLRRGPS